MANKSVFSTPRNQTQTADQMLESLIQKRNAQLQNRTALAEATKMQKNTEDFTVAMEATNAQTEQELQTTAAMERMAYETGTRNIARQQLGIRQQMIQEGMEIVTGQVIGEMIYESYWLDEPVKEATVEQIAESIANTWQYIEENCKESYVPENKQSKLMQNLHYVIESTVKEAADRICKECEETDTAFPGFELTDAEEERMDEKLVDLGRDEIVTLIKDKVAAVVQDEKEKGQERSEMFTELEKVVSDDGEQSGATTEPIDGEGNQTPETGEDAGAEEGTPTEDGDVSESVLNIKYALGTSDYTAGERHIAKLMESGAQIALFDDPTWGEFKSCVTMCTKRIRELLTKADIAGENKKECYCCAKSIIEDLEAKLSNVPETVPGDVKTFVMTMVNTIYGAVPADEVIISRFGNPLGTPDLGSSNQAVDLATVSWTDLFVNIKTNLSSIKSYCDNKCNDEVIDNKDVNDSDCPVTGKNSLAQLIAKHQSQLIAKNMGSSLFEAMMIGAIKNCSKAAMESTANIDDEAVEDAALIETLLQYTVFETLDTIGMYDFRMNDIKNAKWTYMNPVAEADITTNGADSQSSSTGSSDGKVLSVGKNRKGLKAVRINTSKMKKKTANSMKTNLPTPDTSE